MFVSFLRLVIQNDERYVSIGTRFGARVFELHSDEVAYAPSVAGRDRLKGFVQCPCGLLNPNRWQEILRRPTQRDLIGQDPDAVAGLLRAISGRKRYSV